jgi:hypothetical protein
MIVKNLFFVIIGSLSLWLPAFAEAPADAGVERTEVVVLDDWPGAEPLSTGTIKCPGGELEMLDEVTPFCAATGLVNLRDLALWSCFTSDDPRLTGVTMFTLNGNLDAAYTGPVWGKWTTVPSQRCDPTDLIEPSVYWKGTWQGQRKYHCDGGSCFWIGDLDVVGKGHGGIIDGIHIKGTELATTYTPLPIPWEFIPGFPVTGPEGVATLTLKE